MGGGVGCVKEETNNTDEISRREEQNINVNFKELSWRRNLSGGVDNEGGSGKG